MAKKDLFRKAVKNSSTDTAHNLGKMIGSQSRDKNIIIHPELKPLIPALLPDERELLENSIRKEGVREKIVIWKQGDNDYYIIDGHNRYEIVQKLQGEGLSVKYAFREQEFDSLEDVKYWMVINQFSRRNLTDKQRTYLMGLRYEMEKEGHGGDRKSRDKIWPLKNNEESQKTYDRLAEEFSVSKNTIKNASLFAKGVNKLDQKLRADVLSGDSKINKSAIQKLAHIELDDKVDSLDKIEKLVKPKPKSKSKPKKTVNPFKKVVASTQEEIFVMITGKWLLENQLEDVWAEKRKIDVSIIDESFEDQISLKEAIRLGMLSI